MDAYLTLLINGSDSAYVDGIAMLATKVWVWLPLYCAILFTVMRNFKRRNALIVIAALVLTVVICDQVASSIFKPLVCRLRPSHDPELAGLIDLVDGYRGGRYGFFSSHAANTMGITMLLGLLLQHRITIASLAFWSLLNCWTRVYLGLHFVGDIVTGLVFGAIVGSLIYYSIRHFSNILKCDMNSQSKKSEHAEHSKVSLWLQQYCIPTTFFVTLLIIAVVA